MFEALTNEELGWFKGHIDATILNLIIKMNVLPFLETLWSCGGHFTNHRMYHNGIRFAIDETNEGGEMFVNELTEIIEKNFPFAHLHLTFDDWRKRGLEHPEYTLDVKSIEYPRRWKDGYILRKEDEDNASRLYERKYGRLHKHIEGVVNRWIVNIGREEETTRLLEEI